MVKISTNINKANNDLSSQLIDDWNPEPGSGQAQQMRRG